MADEPYREVAPAPALAAYVDRFWSRRTVSVDGAAHRVLPDGCIDLIVDRTMGTAELVGPMSRAALVPGGASHVVAARFRPGVGARFAGLPLARLRDQSVPLAELGIDTRALLDAIAEGAAMAPLARFIHAQLSHADPIDRLVRRAIDRLTREPTGPIATLADELGVSRQYLARIFAHEVGVSPKVLARIARMQRVMIAIRADRRDWSRLARELGFSDQAHLVHDATELAGLSPTRLAAEVSISPIASIYGALEGSA